MLDKYTQMTQFEGIQPEQAAATFGFDTGYAYATTSVAFDNSEVERDFTGLSGLRTIIREEQARLRQNAVIYGIYSAPTQVIRPDIRERVNDNGECYFQVLHRLSSQSYAIRVAASCKDLITLSRNEDDNSIKISSRVFVSTISRQDLHTQCTLLIAPRAAEPVYVAPDCILKEKQSGGKELQLWASSAWLCYFQIQQSRSDGSFCVRVAALPDRLASGSSDRTYVTYLSQDEFALALPLEHRGNLATDGLHLDMATCDLREKVEQHAKLVLHRPIEHPRAAKAKPENTGAFTCHSLQEDFHLVQFKDPIFLRKEDIVTTDKPADTLEKAMDVLSQQQDAIVAQMSQRVEQFQHAETRAEQQDLLTQQRNAQRQTERIRVLHGWLEEVTIWYTSLRTSAKPPITHITQVLLHRSHALLRNETGKIRRDENGKRMYATQEEWAYLLTICIPTTLSVPAKMLREKPIVRTPKPIEYGSKPPVIMPKSVQCAVA